jgi:Pyridoxamine 5'-phosphate oxidase
MNDSTLTWPEVAARLAPWRSYWLGTTTPSGAPHAAPVWGAVLDDVFYIFSELSTVKARNIAADPRVIVHLESGEEVLIARGVADEVGGPADLPRVLAAFAAKYTSEDDRQYLPGVDPAVDVIYAIRPRSAMMWRLADYEKSQRRWTRG